MCYPGLLKRIIPFALTFAAGLFVASFFVSIALPEPSWRSNRRCDKSRMMQLSIENENLRDKNLRQQMEIDELHRNAQDWGPDAVPPIPTVELEAPHHPPPPPPKRPKQPRFDIVQ